MSTRLARRWRRLARRAEAGMTTAEYAVGILMACGFAAVLFTVLRSDGVRGLLTAVVEGALRSVA